ALERFEQLMSQALASIPDCRGAKALKGLLRAESQRLIPSHIHKVAVAEPARQSPRHEPIVSSN
ncbi:MAG: hypothetical protein EBX71_07425, partial [Betaproteobacteria bacterium]|nr:hypothetical protein [Betaproteobacteria bacterium]